MDDLSVYRDRIKFSNLNRQLFWERKDVGELKVTTLKSAISNRFESVTVDTHSQEMDINALIPLAKRHASGVAVTADSPGTLAWDANRVCREINIPVVSGGYFHQYCVANYFCPFTETDFETDDELASRWTRLPSSVMPSYGPTNMALASILCSALISGLIGTMPKGNKIMQWNSSVHPHEIRLSA
ncbi:ThiF family adenylyltransferase [Pseudomonas sp. NPDC089734]|uniref:ThiF family adenylyltransferase n=1 Tax=Pseudomonas sp. NPDC089734 TaxID=3364469 RepID=UPI0037FCFCF4